MSSAISKAVLRKQAAARRDAAFAAGPVAALSLSAWAPRGVVERPGLIVSGYWPFRSEIDPRPLMQRFAKAGATLALPVTPAKGADAPLRFLRWDPEDLLHPSAFGVQEPHPSKAAADPDILLVPLLAFDRAGGRLGYGAGHYDRTLERLRAIKPVLAVGLAFAAQEVEAVPMDAHDQRLDAILTERGYLPVGDARRA